MALLFFVIVLTMLILFNAIREKQIELLMWLKDNAYSGPIVIMVVVLIQTIFLQPRAFMAIGTGYSLHLVHEESFKSVLVSSLAVWTGFWIGCNLNAKLVKYLLRDMCREYF